MGSLWMLVSRDKYEWPLVIADNRQELARKLGVTAASISERICKQKACGGFCKYRHVEWDDKEEE